MKVNENGKIREMTGEEIRVIASEKNEIIPTAEERLEAIEEALLELAEVMPNG